MEVRYGVYRASWPVAGWTVGAVKAKLRDCWNVGYFSSAEVNGQSVTLAATLCPGDGLMFRLPLGRKAAEGDMTGEADLIFASHPDLMRIVAEVIALEPIPERAVALAVRRAVRFMLERFGRPAAGEVVLLHQVLGQLTALVKALSSTKTPCETRVVSDERSVISNQSDESKLPAEMTTAQAAEVLGVSKDTVLRYKDAGLLEYRDIAPPGRSRPVFLFAARAVLSLRTTYRVGSTAAPRQTEPPRRARAGGRRYKHLDIND